MNNRNVYGNCWREHGSAFWRAFVRSGLMSVPFPGRSFSGVCEDTASVCCVVDDFGNLVAVELWS